MPNRPKPKSKSSVKPKPKPVAKAKPASKPPKAVSKPAPKPAAKAPTPVTLKPVPKVELKPPTKVALKPGVPATGAAPRPEGKAAARKSGSSRRSPLANRRGPDGELFVPGDLVLPGGAQNVDEYAYYFRGCSAAERPNLDLGLSELFTKRALEPEHALRAEIQKLAGVMIRRFETGPIEQMLPNRPQPPRRTFQGVAERAKGRRREIGSFLRGLDIGRTEASHMDAHGEASLQSLMEWAARLEILAEADEPTQQADYGQFHRVLDQLDATTEALVVDVEQTLRRLRDRLQARKLES